MTAQAHEKLIYEGEELSIAFCPPLPENNPRIKRLSDDVIIKKNGFINISSACWRGYTGTWEIKEGRFYLVDIIGRYKIIGESLIFADWFSGVIRISRGNILHYVHMGFGSVYEKELHVEIANGIIMKTKVFDNRGKKFENGFEGN